MYVHEELVDSFSLFTVSRCRLKNNWMLLCPSTDSRRVRISLPSLRCRHQQSSDMYLRLTSTVQNSQVSVCINRVHSPTEGVRVRTLKNAKVLG